MDRWAGDGYHAAGAGGVVEVQSKRDAANVRLRVQFLAAAGPQLRQLAALLGQGADVETRESIGYDLSRMAATAGAIKMSELAEAGRRAAQSIQAGADAYALEPVARAIRRAGSGSHFGPVLVRGRDPALERRLGGTSLEALEVVDGDAAVFAGLHTSHPSALVLPSERLRDVERLVREEAFPVVVYGAADDFDARLQAIDAGAAGFLAEPFSRGQLLDLVRWCASRGGSAIEVFVLADPGPQRDTLRRVLQDAGIAAVVSAEPSELVPTLELVHPDAVIVGTGVGGRRGELVVRVIRAHFGPGQIPILAWGDASDPDAFLAAGADDVLDSGDEPGRVTARLRARVQRFAGILRERNAVTGLPNRVAALRELDRHLAHAVRTREPLALVLFRLGGVAQIRARFGRSAAHAVQRFAAEVLGTHIRRVDVVGHLSEGLFCVALPRCTAAQASARADHLEGQFRERCARDRRAEGAWLCSGVVDTEAGVSGLADRADLALWERLAGRES